MTSDPLRYDKLVDEALRGVVRRVLAQVAEKGPPGDHHFFIGFRTTDPGVTLADHLRNQFPREMTIVLQHQFWGLKVSEAAFEVTLSFNGVHERLVVPFAALTSFADPSVKFGFNFQGDRAGLVGAGESAAPAASVPAKKPKATPPAPKPEAEEPPKGDSGTVVTLDSFRKK